MQEPSKNLFVQKNMLRNMEKRSTIDHSIEAEEAVVIKNGQKE